jgi:hypothetical protein
MGLMIECHINSSLIDVLYHDFYPNTFVGAIYRKYVTTATDGFEAMSPGITGRYEILYDERCEAMSVCTSALNKPRLTRTVATRMPYKVQSSGTFPELSFEFI